MSPANKWHMPHFVKRFHIRIWLIDFDSTKSIHSRLLADKQHCQQLWIGNSTAAGNKERRKHLWNEQSILDSLLFLDDSAANGTARVRLILVWASFQSIYCNCVSLFLASRSCSRQKSRVRMAGCRSMIAACSALIFRSVAAEQDDGWPTRENKHSPVCSYWTVVKRNGTRPPTKHTRIYKEKQTLFGSPSGCSMKRPSQALFN